MVSVSDTNLTGEIVLKVCYVPKFKVLAMEAKQLKTKNKEQVNLFSKPACTVHYIVYSTYITTTLLVHY